MHADRGVRAADASPAEWQSLMGVPVDSPQHISFVLAVSPFFTKQEDLLAGQPHACCSADTSPSTWQIYRLDDAAAQDMFISLSFPTWPSAC